MGVRAPRRIVCPRPRQVAPTPHDAAVILCAHVVPRAARGEVGGEPAEGDVLEEVVDGRGGGGVEAGARATSPVGVHDHDRGGGDGGEGGEEDGGGGGVLRHHGAEVCCVVAMGLVLVINCIDCVSCIVWYCTILSEENYENVGRDLHSIQSVME